MIRALIGCLLSGVLMAGPRTPAYLRFKPAHHAFTDVEGLPQNTIMALAVDRDGVLWAGTEDGPAAYDGARWEPRSLPRPGNRMATALVADPDGGMWVGDGGGKLWHWRGGRWEGPWASAEGLGRGAVRCLAYHQSELWVVQERGLSRWLQGRLQDIPLPSGGSRPRVVRSQGGALWVACQGGVARLKAGEPDRWWPGPLGETFRALAFVGDGELRVGGDRGVYRLGAGGLVLEAPLPGMVRALVETRDGAGQAVLWAGTRAGLFAGDGRRWIRMLPEDVTLASIHTLLAEGDIQPHHGLWVGTDAGGLHRLEWSLFLGVTTTPQGPVGPVTAMGTDAQGDTWLAGLGPWLTRVDRAGGVTRVPAPGPASFHLRVEGAHMILGTEDGRVFTREGGGAWRERARIPGGLVRCALEDPELGLLVGTREAGLWQVPRVGRPRRITPETCRALLREGSLLYVGLEDGLSRYRIIGSELERVPGWRAAAGEPVSALTRWEGRLAVGTFSRGLCLLDPEAPDQGQWLAPGGDPGLPHDCVYALAPEGRRLWVATNRGVARVERQGRLLAVDVFLRAHGLPANEANHGGLHLDPQGRVWVGTLGGAAVLDPELRVHPAPRPLVLTLVGQGGAEPARLEPGARVVARAQFPGFYREADVTYRFQVEGLEAAPGPWSPTDRVEVRGVAPGTYRVLAWAHHPELGTQGPVARAFHVKAPWWRRTWALAGGAVLVLVLGFLLVKARESVLARRARRLSQEVAARTADLQAANGALRKSEEERLTLTAMIVHDIRSPLQAVVSTFDLYDLDGELPEDAEAQARKALRQVEDLCNEALELGRAARGELTLDLGWVDLVPWSANLVQQAESLARAKGIQVTSALPPDREGLMDGPRMARVVMNLVGNALKFTPRGGRLVLRITCPARCLRIEVADSGPGIPEDRRADIFTPYHQGREGKGGVGLGLAIVQTFVTAHLGRVWVEGPPEGGARFVVEIPLRD